MSLKASLLRNRATRGVKRILTDNPLYKKFADQRIAKLQEEVDRNRRIEFVENVLPKDGIGAELGVYKGQFSPILLNRSRAAKLHLIDPWYFLTAHWNWGFGNRSTVDAVVNILRSFKKEIEAGRVAVHVGDDRVVLATFPDHYFDWVYIDSSHSYEHTCDELQILRTKVKEAGVIAGDDWVPDPAHWHHGVCKAVIEFIASGEYRVIHSDESTLQWAIARTDQRSQ
jgi:Methyltransferase domain